MIASRMQSITSLVPLARLGFVTSQVAKRLPIAFIVYEERL